jgi:diguanylate cyclase (GGDEF)-like protein
MKIQPVPPDEDQRLARLASLGLVYSPAEERFDRITRLAHKFFGVPVALITLLAEQCNWFKSAQGTSVDQQPREMSFCSHAIMGTDIFTIPDTLLDPAFADNPLVKGQPFIRFYAGHPVMYRGSPMGALCIIDVVPRQLLSSDRESLSSLAKWVEGELRLTGAAVEQTELLMELEEAKRRSLIDPLTKLWNRHGMDMLAEREMKGAERLRQPVSVMMIDVDYFKQINDRFGHPAGDIVLREVAQRIRSAVRPSDVVVRYGGDEFFVLARDCPDKLAAVIGDRVLSRVKDEPVRSNDDRLDISVTIGITTSHSARPSQTSGLIKRADEALYDAKTAGRGCVKFRTF